MTKYQVKNWYAVQLPNGKFRGFHPSCGEFEAASLDSAYHYETKEHAENQATTIPRAEVKSYMEVTPR